MTASDAGSVFELPTKGSGPLWRPRRVTYERNLSDGNGGSERLSLGLAPALVDGELAEECLNDGTVHGLVVRVRAALLRELGCCRSQHVAAVLPANSIEQSTLCLPIGRSAATGRHLPGDYSRDASI